MILLPAERINVSHTGIPELLDKSLNLSFISKILEKIVANRQQPHIKNNHLCNPLQSAYRKHHSTESALLKARNDIIISVDKGEVTALTLLDLSAAFDTIDHATLTDRLSD